MLGRAWLPVASQYNRLGHRFHAKRRGETGIYSDPGLRNLPLNNVRQSTPCN
jgi:hypothetical protein